VKVELPKVLEEMYASGFVTDRKNQRRKAIDSTVSKAEALLLIQIVKDTESLSTLETGVGFGASAVAICHAKKEFDLTKAVHYGIDPNQRTEYAEAAIVSLEKEKLEDQFRLLEGPSHLMIPKLIENGVVLDFAFVDGWHTFDYTLLDFFLIDKLLRPGGMIAFHDMYSLAKQKVLRYILTHRKYKIVKDRRVRGNESRLATIKFFVWRLMKRPRLLLSRYHWSSQLFNSSGLIVIQKNESFEPHFGFYQPF
jgi:predicted O-methyltransferase YrrM